MVSSGAALSNERRLRSRQGFHSLTSWESIGWQNTNVSLEGTRDFQSVEESTTLGQWLCGNPERAGNKGMRVPPGCGSLDWDSAMMRDGWREVGRSRPIIRSKDYASLSTFLPLASSVRDAFPHTICLPSFCQPFESALIPDIPPDTSIEVITGTYMALGPSNLPHIPHLTIRGESPFDETLCTGLVMADTTWLSLLRPKGVSGKERRLLLNLMKASERVLCVKWIVRRVK